MTGVMAGARARVWRYCVFYNVSRPGCQEHSSCQNVTNALQLQRAVHKTVISSFYSQED